MRLPRQWPRPSAYTREFPKLTCVGTGPRPRRVCRHWRFCGRGIGVFLGAGIGVFVVAALVFLGAGIGVFAVAALVFCGRGIGVSVVAALGRVDPLRTLAMGAVGS